MSQLIERLEEVFGPSRDSPEAGPLGRPRVWRTAAGVEIAALDAREARRTDLIEAWRRQRRNRPDPVLLLVGDSDELTALGPEGVRPDPQRVRTDLPKALDFLATDGSREEAVQRLQSILADYAADGQASQGVRPAGLFTPHFLFTRLPRRPFWQELVAAAPGGVPSDWRSLLADLGYELESLDDGFIARSGGEAIAVVRSEASAEALDRPLSDLHDLPYRRLGELMREHRLENGLLVGGSVVRLFALERVPTRLPDRFLELRLDRLDLEQRPYLGILAPGILGEQTGIKRLLVEARQYGAELRQGLEVQIRDQALPGIVAGLTEEMDAERLAEPVWRRSILDGAFTLLFRLVFLLYCESADYLPVRSERYGRHSLTALCGEARRDWPDGLDADAQGLWHGVRALVSAMRTGNRAWGVPAYDGALFAPGDLTGAQLLEEATLTDEHLGRALVALAYDLSADEDEAPGVDWAGLGVANIGSIYENLLHLRLSYATEDLRYDEQEDRYVLAQGEEEVTQPTGSVFLQTERGGRKAGGVYYTQELFVEHLVEGAVGPPLTDHLTGVAELAKRDPNGAAERLLDFRICDPAMGSGHFLKGALDYLAAEIGAFLGEHPLPAIERALDELRASAEVGEAMPPTDRDLLRRLLVKRCIYGVDRSDMAVELAKISLWLSSFVPGLPLSVLDHNLAYGDSLVGVDRSSRVGERVGPLLTELIEGPLHEAVDAAARAAEPMDRSLEEVRQSEDALREARQAARRVERVYDAVTTLGFDRNAAGAVLGDPGVLEALLTGDVEGKLPPEIARVDELEAEQLYLHWPLVFPEVFERENPGFDAVVGNPPWSEVVIERTGFFIPHDPGLGAVRSATEREARIETLIQRFPELAHDYERTLGAAERLRNFFRSGDGDYELQGRGHLDLYEIFLERYGTLLRDRGGLGVVLPRSAFYIDGTVALRRWLFKKTQVERIDFLLNDRRWAFDMEPRYTVSLLVGRRLPPRDEQEILTSGPHRSRGAFEEREPVPVARAALARWTRPRGGRGEPTWEVPLLPTAAARDIWDRLMNLPRLDEGRPRDWNAFAIQGDFNVTADRRFIRPGGDWDVWSGGTFEQLTPWFGSIAGHCDAEDGLARLDAKRRRSSVWRERWSEALRDPDTLPARTFRIAFRDVTNRTNSQTVIACLVPPGTFLTNKAPFLVLPEGGAAGQAFLLGVMNSLPFNWQARRLVEISLNFFILYFMRVPDISPISERGRRIGDLAARLNAVDESYRPFADELGVEVGPFTDERRLELRAELEAEVALAYGLGVEDLELIFDDFTERALSSELRAAIRSRI